MSFLRKGAIAGGAALSGGAILERTCPGRRPGQWPRRRPASARVTSASSTSRSRSNTSSARSTTRRRERARSPTPRRSNLPEGHHARRAQARRVPQEGAGGKAAVKEPKFNFPARPPTRRRSSRPRTSSRTPASTRTSARRRNIKDAKIPACRGIDRDDRGAPLRGDRVDHQQVDQPQRRFRQRPPRPARS